ncbi:MAG: hypothetical protein Terrestrivirus11_3 [Terrestrivirus sp.]|uniref:Uncharacterized protein n=1 Tax=Terrestrivirus sp. TaxID=2487775 RepID=A0A3G4ZP40_9VIRU|nr:MAG: hypothetical protein Terrestrivirus11_3 [Terrestrivirus sp.]
MARWIHNQKRNYLRNEFIMKIEKIQLLWIDFLIEYDHILLFQ